MAESMVTPVATTSEKPAQVHGMRKNGTNHLISYLAQTDQYRKILARTQIRLPTKSWQFDLGETTSRAHGFGSCKGKRKGDDGRKGG
jgi:hypothetical protein